MSFASITDIGPCIGSGSYGTVHYVTALVVMGKGTNINTSNSGGGGGGIKRERISVVGKRAWSEAEILRRNVYLATEQLKETAERCRYYWSVERHCLEKINSGGGASHPGLPVYLGTATDNQQRTWMLFDVLEAPPNALLSSDADEEDDFLGDRYIEIAPSLHSLMERDRVDPRQTEVSSEEDENDGDKKRTKHHLFTTSQALLLGGPQEGDDSLAATLDVVMKQILEILVHVHSFSIVHRDVKPSNILVAHQDGVSRLVLIDFGSAGDVSTSGLLKKNIGMNSNRVTISPLYSAPEVFFDSSDTKNVVNFDCFSTALLYLQLLFQYLDERTESGFHQQLLNAQWDLDVWLHTALQSKVRPAGLEQALQVIEDRPGLWKLLQDMLRVRPGDRLSSSAALERFNKILDNALRPGTRLVAEKPDEDLYDGPYLMDVLETLKVCEVPSVWPLQYVASFDRQTTMGLYLAEADADISELDEVAAQQWKQATVDARIGDVFVQEIIPGSQADLMGVVQVGDRLQGVGEIPLGDGGFDRAVQTVRKSCRKTYPSKRYQENMSTRLALDAQRLHISNCYRSSEQIKDQPKLVDYVTLHFDRKSSFELLKSDTEELTKSVLEGPTQVIDQGAWSFKGRREVQEDTYILLEVNDMAERSMLLAGVFDGHCGSAASSFVQSELPEAFSAALNVGEGASIQSLLDGAWNMCCDAYRESCLGEDECIAEYDPVEGLLKAYTGSEDAVGGTTATVLALDQQTSVLAVLNCGDSRGIVMDSTGRMVFQTTDHTPRQELDRLTAGAKQGLGYSIPECRVGQWIVKVGIYEYAVARSLEGPFVSSKGITSLADVSVMQAEPGMTALVATDGLWEVIDSAEACQIVISMKEQDRSAGDAAKVLCSLAYERASNDNISVVVVYFG